MNKELNKHMPYNVPDGYFDRLETDVWAEIKRRGTEAAATDGPTAATRRKHRTAVLTILAAAASLLLLFTLQRPQTAATPQAVGMEQIDRAFAQLSPADQNFLMEVYADDELADDNSGN